MTIKTYDKEYRATLTCVGAAMLLFILLFNLLIPCGMIIVETFEYSLDEKSVYIISGYMKLTREEALAINWHMGGFDARVLGGSYALGSVFAQNQLY